MTSPTASRMRSAPSTGRRPRPSSRHPRRSLRTPTSRPGVGALLRPGTETRPKTCAGAAGSGRLFPTAGASAAFTPARGRGAQLEPPGRDFKLATAGRPGRLEGSRAVRGHERADLSPGPCGDLVSTLTVLEAPPRPLGLPLSRAPAPLDRNRC